MANLDGVSDKHSMIEPVDGSASANLVEDESDSDQLVSESESAMSFAAGVAFSADSSELNESYDPVKEFEELVDKVGLRAPLAKKELLWRKAMYCRYRCNLINLDQHTPQNTWAEVARFVGWPDWKELKMFSTRKFLQLTA